MEDYTLEVAISTRHGTFFANKVTVIKIGLSASKENNLFASMRMIKNAFYFTLKALFVPNIFKCLSLLFGDEEKMT